MLLGIIMRLIPEDKKILLKLAMRITASLDTARETNAVAEYGMTMMNDCKVTVAELAKFGSKLGILTGKH